MKSYFGISIKLEKQNKNFQMDNDILESSEEGRKTALQFPYVAYSAFDAFLQGRRIYSDEKRK